MKYLLLFSLLLNAAICLNGQNINEKDSFNICLFTVCEPQSYKMEFDLKNADRYVRLDYVRLNSIIPYIKKNPEHCNQILDTIISKMVCLRDTNLYKWFLKVLPDSKYIELIQYKLLKISGNKSDYENFLYRFPNTKYRSSIEDLINIRINTSLSLCYEYRFGELVPSKEYMISCKSQDNNWHASFINNNAENGNYSEILMSFKLKTNKYNSLVEASEDLSYFWKEVKGIYEAILKNYTYPFNDLNTLSLKKINIFNDTISYNFLVDENDTILKEIIYFDNKERPTFQKTNEYDYSILSTYEYLSKGVIIEKKYIKDELISKFKHIVSSDGLIKEKYKYDIDGGLQKVYKIEKDSINHITTEWFYSGKEIQKFISYFDKSDFFISKNSYYSIDGGKTYKNRSNFSKPVMYYDNKGNRVKCLINDNRSKPLIEWRYFAI